MSKEFLDPQVYEVHLRCIVCDTHSAVFFADVASQTYLRCSTCQATFLDPTQRISIKEEHVRYREHQNNPADKGYRLFLTKLAEPLLQLLPPQAKGLDYGCGQGSALAAMLGEAGHRMTLFDPLFYPDTKALDDLYDFITCTETIEHFHRPSEEFARLDRLLRPGGWLALMTCFQTDDNHFASWHYRRDSTHVVFYREATLRYIARQFGWRCTIPVKDVAIMQKPHDPSMSLL